MKPGSYHIGHLKIGNVVFLDVTAGVYTSIPELDKSSPRIGVYGNAFDQYSPTEVGIDLDKITHNAQLIGELVAKEGLILVNGACPGIPNIVAQSSRAKNGLVTGFSPLENEYVHLKEYRLRKDELPHALIAYLGKQKNNKHRLFGIEQLFITRDIVNIFSSNAIIVIGGSYGTNHEVAIAAELGLPVMLLKGTGGVADQAKQYYESIRKPNNTTVFIEETHPRSLLERLLEELFKRSLITREFQPGKDPLDTVIERIEMQQQAA